MLDGAWVPGSSYIRARPRVRAVSDGMTGRERCIRRGEDLGLISIRVT